MAHALAFVTQFHHAEVERGLGFVLRIQYHHYTGTMAFSKSAMVTVALSMVSPWDTWPLLRLVPSPQLCIMETKWCRKGTRGAPEEEGLCQPSALEGIYGRTAVNVRADGAFTPVGRHTVVAL
jgi:hypothetical protein